MSSGERSSRAVWVVVVVGALLIVASIVFGLVVVPGWESAPASGPSSPQSQNPTSARTSRTDPGIGDPYQPSAGGPGYDVLSYSLDLDVDPQAASVAGTATLSLRTTDDLPTLHLDLGLPASAVSVDGREARYAQDGLDLAVELGSRGGTAHEVKVTYAGRPADVRLSGPAVYVVDDELLIAGEPESAAAWYPANDHPRDPATFEAKIRVPTGYEAISVGRLVQRGAVSATTDEWHWRTDEPAPTYTTMLAVGQYVVEQGDATVAGRGVQAVYAVSEKNADPGAATSWLKRSPQAADRVAKYLGAYPVSAIGGVVPGMGVDWGGLETLGRPIYEPRLVGRDSVLYHELAHMWQGNTVTLHEWRSIFINESLTSYVEWLAVADAGGTGVQKRFDDTYAQAPDRFWSQRLSDPAATGSIFSNAVYTRGAMVVHATRVRMGDEAFFRLLQRWASQEGSHALEQWRQMAIEMSPNDLRPLFAAWLDGTTKPAATPENGFR